MPEPQLTGGTTPAGASRQTFNDEVFNRATQFGRDLLQLVPELEGVAIIPTFAIPNERLPSGVIVGRMGPLRTPGEIMHMAVALHSTLNTVMHNAFECLKAIDAHAGNLRTELKNLTEQVDAKRRELAALDGCPATADGVRPAETASSNTGG